MSLKLIPALIRRQAQLAVSPSTARGQRKGTVLALREALAEVRLEEFRIRSKAQFTRALDRNTLRIRDRVPRNASSWGLARKCLNMFLRDCYYNRFLFREFELYRAEAFYEVPLDSMIAEQLKD